MPKPQRFCIFCGGSPITAEHLWPEWMAPLLGKYGAGTTQRFGRSVRHPTTDEVVFAVRDHFIKGRESTSETMSVLCDRCNNEWGSLLETAATSALKKLVKGDRHTISPTDLTVIVRWLTLKFFVADDKDCEAQATLQPERAAFRESFVIPDSLRISIAPIPSGKWSASFHFFSTSASFLKPGEAIEAVALPKNVASLSMGFGRCFAHIVYARVDYPPVLRSRFIDRFVQIWPLQPNSVDWPPTLSLPETVVDDFAFSMERGTQDTKMFATRRRIRLKVVGAMSSWTRPCSHP
jgi:hypothetical protein